ncbi:cytochrome P450 [Lentinula raphanica]|nr:cytochrome P450 [Lentinula raphanica]
MAQKSHLLFKRVEPSVISFLALVLGIYAAAGTYTYATTSRIMDIILFAGLVVSGYLSGLSSSIILYRLSPWHPLSQYPGPTPAKITKWYMAFWIAKGSRHLKLQELHRIYGPWIRIGPNELSVDEPSAIRPIYSQMFRSLSYQGAPQDADALITTVDKNEHALRLVAWSRAFSARNLKSYRTSAKARTLQLLQILSQKQDVVLLSHWISLWARRNQILRNSLSTDHISDVMGDMSFSGGFETMAAGQDTEGWMEMLHMGVLFVGVLGQVPWIRDILALAPAPGPILAFQKFAGQRVEETKSKTNGMRNDILTIIQNDIEGGMPLSKLQAHADASFIVLAGSDTVSEAMTALLRYLTGHTAVQDRLRSELTEAFDGPVEDMDSSVLLKLPYLDACIQEALRLVPPVAAGPPRWNRDTETPVLDKVIPAGTTVACPNYSIFRDPRNFVRPDEFLPERWLEGTPYEPCNVEAFVPFCYGPGVCIGKPVALYNMKLLTSILIRSFKLSFPPDFNVDEFDASYKEHNLWVHDELRVILEHV